MMGNETRRDRKMGGKEAGKLPREGNDTIVKRRKKEEEKKDGEKIATNLEADKLG